MLAPAAGPAHPFRFHNPGETTGKIAGLGVIASTAMDEYAFQEQFHNFKSYGYAMDRDGNAVGNLGHEDARAQSSTIPLLRSPFDGREHNGESSVTDDARTAEP